MGGSAWRARFSFADILGTSEALQTAMGLAHAAADAAYPTLILGESGTGKELFAHAIHAASRRCGQPFVAVNCGTLGGELAVTELCGYEPGSFTGADHRTHQGLLDVANRGTLFLDELQDMHPVVQSVLLRFLETGTFIRVGGTRPVESDVRVLAASNLDAPTLERGGQIRSDLLYRLNCLVIEIPPLRERREDVPAIAQKVLREELHFLGEVDAEVWRALAGCPHPWPGNARGLRNFLLRAILSSSRDRLAVEDLPKEIWVPAARSAPARATRSAEDAEAIRAVIDASDENVSEAARRLGVHRSTIYRRLARSEK